MLMLLDRPRQHPDQDDAVVVDGDDLGDSRTRLRVSDDDERSGHELTAALDIVDMRVRKAVGVAPEVVHPDVEPGFHHDKRTGGHSGIGAWFVEAILE